MLSLMMCYVALVALKLEPFLYKTATRNGCNSTISINGEGTPNFWNPWSQATNNIFTSTIYSYLNHQMLWADSVLIRVKNYSHSCVQLHSLHYNWKSFQMGKTTRRSRGQGEYNKAKRLPRRLKRIVVMLEKKVVVLDIKVLNLETH